MARSNPCEFRTPFAVYPRACAQSARKSERQPVEKTKPMKLTKEQLELSQQLHNSGLTWSMVASYFKTNEKTLRQQRKQYEQLKDNNKN